jgi:tetrahydromethanopterin S-methyltransferase subunit H
MIIEELKNQKIYRIGNIEIGGVIGENPCLLIGSIFYWSHKIVEDAKKGVFNKVKAEELINLQDSLAERTGLNCAYDVVAQTPKAMENYIDFVASYTEYPIIIDAVPEKVRLHGAQYSIDSGLDDRTIYNSIAPWTKDTEIDALRDIGLQYAILFTSDIRAEKAMSLTVDEKMESLKNLITQSSKAGIENLLVDVQSISIGDLGSAGKTCLEVKKKYGYPAGCGTGNGVTVWTEPKKWSREAINGVYAAANSIMSVLYSDFLFFGPIEKAKWVFPAVAVAEIIKTDLTGQIPNSSSHPAMKFFPEIIYG